MAISALHWRSLTATVNNAKPPAQFIRDLLFSRVEEKASDKIDVWTISRGRQIAPFVVKDGEAFIPVGSTAAIATIEPANIRLKKPFTPSPLLEGRLPGNVIYLGGDEHAQLTAAIREYIAQETGFLLDDVINSEEYLASMITDLAVLQYQGGEGFANFKISAPRAAANNAAPALVWDDPATDDVDLDADFHTAKKLISDAVSAGVRYCLLGEEAAMWFRTVARKQKLTLDKQQLDQGFVTLVQQFTAAGAIYLGRYDGVDVWEYSRKVNVQGTDTYLIRPKRALFIADPSALDAVFYYGAIPDVESFGSGALLKRRRFSKSWRVPDPSAEWLLLTERPLPWIRRPDGIVSMKVVSGVEA